MSRSRDLLGLAVFLAVGVVVLALGGRVTATSVGSWYQTIAKPSFNPPDWIFAPVWTALFIAMSVAAWRVWRVGGLAACRAEMGLYAIQLAFNLGWSVIFFGLRQIGWGFVEMMAFFVLIVATGLRFSRIDRIAGWLFVPYAAWVAYALVLNGSIWLLN
jgi:benzodiazapine receptor